MYVCICKVSSKYVQSDTHVQPTNSLQIPLKSNTHTKYSEKHIINTKIAAINITFPRNERTVFLLTAEHIMTYLIVGIHLEQKKRINNKKFKNCHKNIITDLPLLYKRCLTDSIDYLLINI